MSEGNKRALIVEDEPHITEALLFLFAREGINADAVNDGADALSRLGQYDLVVLDIMLPGASGFEIAEAAMAAPSRPKICVLTAKGQAADKARMAQIGVNAFVTKPFSNRELMDTVKSLIGGS